MARPKQHPGNAHAPTQASKHTIKRDMCRSDPFAITAPMDEGYRGRREDAEYVAPSTTDLYGPLVPAWQEGRHE
jgi:hypothetical protein